MKLVLTVAVCLVPLARAAQAAHASWDDQLLEMEYLLLRISAINAINGLGLDRKQTLELRRLTRQVEQAGARPPRPRGAFRPDLAEVRDTYRQLEQIVLHQRPVSDALKKRVARARIIESPSMRIDP